MLEAFIVTLREGVEAALIVGITLAYLSKINRPELRKSVYAALISAFVGSLGVAALLSRTRWNQDIFEGWVMLAAAFFVITMIIFMMKTGRRLKGEIEGKVGLLAGRNAWFGLFAFVFLMVLREGVETVLILSAVSLNSTELLSFLGTFLGVIAAIAFGVMFVKGSVRINLQKFFRVTTVILFFVAAQLVISGLHELSENGVLPSSKTEMAIIGPIVRNDLFFFITIFALAALMVLFELKRRQPGTLPTSPAERRKAVWSARRERLVDGLRLRQFVRLHRSRHRRIHLHQKRECIVTRNGSHICKRPSQYSAHPSSGRRSASLRRPGKWRTVRFWLYQKPDGKIATVLDACEICGAVGFYKGPNGVVCKNCAAPINPQSVGMPGGCNPVPLRAQVTSDAVIIQEADIAAKSRMFQQ